MPRIPNKDQTRPKTEQGVYQKYRVERVDFTDQPGCKHHGCFVFCLDVTHDPYARLAALKYAEACESAYPALAQDLRRLVREAESLYPSLDLIDHATGNDTQTVRRTT